MFFHSLMQDALCGGGFPGACGFGAGRRCGGRSAMPAGYPDLEETDAGWLLTVNLPGLTASDVTVETHQAPGRGAQLRRSLQIHALPRFEETFVLPAEAVADSITASLVDGVLTVAIPKTPEPAPVEIAVQDSAAPAEETQEGAEAGGSSSAAAAGSPPAVLKVPVPGFSAAQLTLKAHTAADGSGVLEVSAGEGQRVVARLPRRTASPADITAFCQHGLLTILVPRDPLPISVEVPLSDGDLEGSAAEGFNEVMCAPVPGMAAGDLSVRVDDTSGRLTVQAKEGTTTSNGRSRIHFAASLPAGTWAEGVVGSVKDGVLTVVAPPPTSPSTRVLPVDAATATTLPTPPAPMEE